MDSVGETSFLPFPPSSSVHLSTRKILRSHEIRKPFSNLLDLEIRQNNVGCPAEGHAVVQSFILSPTCHRFGLITKDHLWKALILEPVRAVV